MNLNSLYNVKLSFPIYSRKALGIFQAATDYSHSSCSHMYLTPWRKNVTAHLQGGDKTTSAWLTNVAERCDPAHARHVRLSKLGYLHFNFTPDGSIAVAFADRGCDYSTVPVSRSNRNYSKDATDTATILGGLKDRPAEVLRSFLVDIYISLKEACIDFTEDTPLTVETDNGTHSFTLKEVECLWNICRSGFKATKATIKKFGEDLCDELIGKQLNIIQTAANSAKVDYMKALLKKYIAEVVEAGPDYFDSKDYRSREDFIAQTEPRREIAEFAKANFDGDVDGFLEEFFENVRFV